MAWKWPGAARDGASGEEWTGFIDQGVTLEGTLTVTGTESVTVPAGTFATYRVEMTGLEQALTYFVTTAEPFRIVKMTFAGAPVEFVLVK